MLNGQNLKRELEKVGNREGRRLQERINNDDWSKVNDIKSIKSRS